MNREQVSKEIKEMDNRSVLCELPTSYGKSRIGIELALKYSPSTILIVVPRLVLIGNWKAEFVKWGYSEWLPKLEFSTYKSLHKRKDIIYDCIIFDEVQHLSERCREIVAGMELKRTVLLSATVTREMRENLRELFPDFGCYKVQMKKAIEEGTLPDPKVYLIPLELDTVHPEYTMIEHPRATRIQKCLYKERWNYLKDKSLQVHIRCTEAEYVRELGNKIDFWKQQYMRTRNEGVRARWLQFAGQRLKFLSNLKNPVIRSILKTLKSERVLTFCSTIEQTEVLGENCINSRNKDSAVVLDRFNKGKVNHITSCNMLNEGVNLVNCRVGLYANLNSSEIIIKQRLGRILRHKDPIIIIPYYKGTREEELVGVMLEDYNKDLITTMDLTEFYEKQS